MTEGRPRRGRALASVLLVALTAFGPLLVAATSVVWRVLGRRWADVRASLLRWSLVLGPLWAVAIVAADPFHVQSLVLWVVAVGVALVPFGPPRAKGVVVALAVVASFQAYEMVAYRASFAPLVPEAPSLQRLVAVPAGVQALEVDALRDRPWYRSWRLQGSSSDVAVSLEVRGIAGEGRRWYGHGVAERSGEAGFDVLTFAADEDARAWRTWTADGPLGGRTFRLSGVWRLPERLEDGACGPVELAVDAAPWVRSCARAVGGDRFELMWTVPDDVTEDRLRIMVAPRREAAIGVRNVELWERRGGDEIEARGVAPVDVVVQLQATGGDGTVIVTTGAPVPATWSSQVLEVPASAGVGSITRVVATVRAPPGARLEVRNVAVAASGARATPEARPDRAQAWFGHPNVAAHAVVGLALAGATAAATRGGRWLALALGLVTVVLTGSRSGFAAMLAGVVLIGPWSEWATRRLPGAVVSLLTAIGLILVVTSAGARVGDLGADAGALPRSAIWGAAIDAVRERPWNGWGSDGAPTVLAERLGATQGTVPIAHAHSWWLEMALRFGLPGFVAALWATIAIVRIGARAGGAVAWSLVCLSLTNLVDTTFPVTYVWAPLVLLASRGPETPSRERLP